MLGVSAMYGNVAATRCGRDRDCGVLMKFCLRLYNYKCWRRRLPPLICSNQMCCTHTGIRRTYLCQNHKLASQPVFRWFIKILSLLATGKRLLRQSMKQLSMPVTSLKQPVHCLLCLPMDSVIRNLWRVYELCLLNMAFPRNFCHIMFLMDPLRASDQMTD